MRNLLFSLIFLVWAAGANATLSDDIPKEAYAGNGATTVFPVPFEIFSETATVEVWLRVNSTGVETEQTDPAEFSIAGTDVTMVTAPASGETLVVKRVRNVDQLTDFVDGDAFPAETHETILDKFAASMQEFREQISRTLLQKNTSTGSFTLPDPEANKLLAWNTGATDLENVTNTAGPAGPTGAAGSDGNTVLNGTVDPTTEGVDGDFFIRTDTDEIFGPKAAGSWPASGVSLVGPTGAAGTNGTNGTNGANGTNGIAISAHHLNGIYNITFERIDGFFQATQAITINGVDMVAFNSGTSGNTIVTVRRDGTSGATSQTATLPANGGTNTAQVTFGASISMVVGDYMWVDITTVPTGGGEDLSVEFK